MLEILVQKSKNITAAGHSDIKPAWIELAERRLGFALPASYKRMLLRYASVSAAGTELKTIAPPEFADDADADICYTYKINLKNGLFAADELVFLQLEDEEYYFKISPANDATSDIADDSSDSVRAKAAINGTTKKAADKASDDEICAVADGVVKNDAVTSAAANRAAGESINMMPASNKANDAADGEPCEYPVYVRDYAQSEDRFFAEDFYKFLEKF